MKPVTTLLLPYFPDSSTDDALEALLSKLSPEQRTRLESYSAAMVELLRPLTQVQSKAELESLLLANYSRFLELKKDILDVFWGVQEDPAKPFADIYSHVREAAASKAELLGGEALEQFLGALESAEGLAEWALESLKAGELAIQRLLVITQQIAQPAGYVDMVLSALVLIVFDTISDWQPEAIPLLSSAADDYMTDVEDVFFQQSPLASLSDTNDLVDFETARRELGL